MDAIRNTLLISCLFMVLSGPAAGQALRAGYAKADVTPDEAIMMAGYALRNTPSEGIHGADRLFLRALAFDNGAARILLISSDCIGNADNEHFRRTIADATGLDKDHVILSEVHNHSAPMTRVDRDRPWDRKYAAALLDAAKRALADLQPVRLGNGTGTSRVGVNRRQVQTDDRVNAETFDENARSQSFGEYKTDTPVQIRHFAGVIRLGANPGGPLDTEVPVVRIDKANGDPLAVMINYGCHGTSLGGRNPLICAEWMGHMQAYVEQQFPGLGVIYLQGAAGDVNPRHVGGLDGKANDIAVTAGLGEEMGREVARVYRSVTTGSDITPRIEIHHEVIALPRCYREILYDDFKNTVVEVPTWVLRIGDLMCVSFPGEMFGMLGKRAKALCPAPFAMLLGYANGAIGYFPEQKAWSEGGYEIAQTHLDPVAEQIYFRELEKIMRKFE